MAFLTEEQIKNIEEKNGWKFNEKESRWGEMVFNGVDNTIRFWKDGHFHDEKGTNTISLKQIKVVMEAFDREGIKWQ